MPSKIKVLNIVGARPQIIKASAINRIISSDYASSIDEIILHTGQHYDKQLSDIFFEELGISPPDYNLNVRSGKHGSQTAAMIKGIEDFISNELPDCVVIYGDTNSTLAAAIACSKEGVPIVHIEAGLRSFNKCMPEEINRILSDHVSTLLFAPTKAAVMNLSNEGICTNNIAPFSIDNPKVVLAGDLMYDNSMYFSDIAESRLMGYLEKIGITNDNYLLATIHRASNTDDNTRLLSIFNGLIGISSGSGRQLVIPLHPRTLQALERSNSDILYKLRNNKNVIILPPVSFLEMIMLERHCGMVITDSGGLQKEAHFFRKPCIVVREETEWVELVENETAILAEADGRNISESYELLASKSNLVYPHFYGDGKAAEKMLIEISGLFTRS